MNCKLQQLGDGWWCPTCDLEQRRLLPRELRRNCRVVVRQARKHMTEQVVEDIADDITENTRTLDEIRKTLEKCFGGCRHMKRWCRKRGHRQLGEQYQAWIEHLLEHDCDPE